MCSEKIDIAFLKNYCGNIYRDIESDKNYKNKKAYEQEKMLSLHICLIKNF